MVGPGGGVLTGDAPALTQRAKPTGSRNSNSSRIRPRISTNSLCRAGFAVRCSAAKLVRHARHSSSLVDRADDACVVAGESEVSCVTDSRRAAHGDLATTRIAPTAPRAAHRSATSR